MERNPTLSCCLILQLMLLAIFTSHSLVQTKEFRRRAVCGDDILYLDCGNTSIIAIHEAAFSSDVTQHENVTCSSHDEGESSGPDVNGTCVEDVRNEINKRCSGLRECNFSYGQLAERKCDARWGSLVIEYDCARESSIIDYCNVRIHSKEGYIASPGYPSFYPPLPNCSWTLATGSGQTVTLRLLHVHLPCDDTVSVLEGNTRRLRVCGESPLQTIEVEGDNGILVQFISENFYPASGFLLYYKVKGCPTLPAPLEGYLVQRNGSSAVYVCCQNHVFNDTQETTKTLQCVGEHRWNDSLVSCVPAEEFRQIYVNRSLEADFENLTTEEMVPNVSEARSSYMEDILIPSILMVALVLGNAVIVCIIMRIRKKQKSKLEVEDDDLSPQTPLPVTREATEV